MRRILLLACIFILCLSLGSAQSDDQIQAAAQKALRAYELATIQSSVQHATVTLTGLVNLCRDRLLAVQMMKHIRGVKAVDDRIEIVGRHVPDEQLQPQVNRIISERIHRLGGFGFGSITARLKDGVVTLTGTAAVRLAEPAIAAIASVAGVRNVVDRVRRIDPYDAGWASNHPGFVVEQ